jgi:outer membrane protein assembly factor BamB
MAQNNWSRKIDFIDFDNSRATQIHVCDEDGSVVVCNPMGITKYSSSGEKLWQQETEGMKMKEVMKKLPNINSQNQSKGINLLSGTPGKTEMPDMFNVRNVIYIKTWNDNFIEFNFDKFMKQSIRLIDGKSGKIVWEINDIVYTNEEVSDYLKVVSSQKNPDLSLAVMFQRILEKDLILIPERNQFILNANSGLYCIDVENGNTIWQNDSFTSKGLLTKVNLYTNSIIAVTYDQATDALLVASSPNFKKESESGEKISKLSTIKGFIFPDPKGIITRINAKTGEEVWKSHYINRLQAKHYDFSKSYIDKRFDMRVINGIVLINTLNIELYNFDTGECLSSTTALPKEIAKLLDLSGLKSKFIQRDVLPVMNDGIIYYVANKYGLKGLSPVSSQSVEAYSIHQKAVIWKSELFTNESFVKINNLVVNEDHIVITFNDRTGLIGIDKETGKKLWNQSTGRRGITAPVMIHNGMAFAPEWRRIHVINMASGNYITQFKTGSKAGTVKNMFIHKENLIVSGYKISSDTIKKLKGVAFYDLKDYNIKNRIIVNGKSELNRINDLWRVDPLYAADRIFLFNASDKTPIVKTGKYKYRNAIAVSVSDNANKYVYSVHHKPSSSSSILRKKHID